MKTKHINKNNVLALLSTGFILFGCVPDEADINWLSPVSVEFSDAELEWRYTAATDRATATYAITDGEDADYFTIEADTGVLRFVTPPDTLSPDDADRDGAYEVELTASDDTSTAALDLEVNVLPSGTGAPQLVFPLPQSNINANGDAIRATLLRAEESFKGQALQRVSVNGIIADYLPDSGMWRADVQYALDTTTVMVLAHYGDGITTQRISSVDNFTPAIEGLAPFSMQAVGGSQYLPESNHLYYLNGEGIERRDLDTGSVEPVLTYENWENRLFFGVTEDEEAVYILDTDAPFVAPLPTEYTAEESPSLIRIHLQDDTTDVIAENLEIDTTLAFASYDFDPASSQFLTMNWSPALLLLGDTEAERSRHQDYILIDAETGDWVDEPLGISPGDGTMFDVDLTNNLRLETTATGDLLLNDAESGLPAQLLEADVRTFLTHGATTDPVTGKIYTSSHSIPKSEDGSYIRQALLEVDPENLTVRELSFIDWPANDPPAQFMMILDIEVSSSDRTLYISALEVTDEDQGADDNIILHDKLYAYSLITGESTLLLMRSRDLPMYLSFRMNEVFFIGLFAEGMW